MKFPQRRQYDNKTYTLTPVIHKTRRSALSYAQDVRRIGYLARVEGNSEYGWYVYTRKVR